MSTKSLTISACRDIAVPFVYNDIRQALFDYEIRSRLSSHFSNRTRITSCRKMSLAGHYLDCPQKITVQTASEQGESSRAPPRACAPQAVPIGRHLHSADRETRVSMGYISPGHEI